MSRWIDADELAKKLTDWSTGTVEPIDWSDIAVAPSIDIVRCRECKYWKSTVQMPNGTEVKCLYGRKDDDFCSYGEREGE